MKEPGTDQRGVRLTTDDELQIDIATCLGCGQSFFVTELTQAGACSYLCIPCADRIGLELLHCDECDPSFGCWEGAVVCIRRPL